MSKIVLKKSSVASKVPLATDLDYGELALNYADGKIYYKKSDGTVDYFKTFSTIGNFSSQTTSGLTTFNGEVLIDNASGSGGSSEGGELHFAIPTANSTLSGPIAIDIYANKLRIFETTGTNRGVYIDLTTASGGVGTNLLGGTGTVTSVGLSVPTGLSVSGSPITGSGTLAITLTAGYSIPTTASQTNWDTAYTDRNKWDGGSTGLVAATARTSLGLVIGTDVQAWDADLDAIAALAGTSGFLKKTAANTWSLDTSTYLPLSGGTINGTITLTDGWGIRAFRDGSSTIASQLYFANSANSAAYNWQLDESNNAALWGYGSTWAKLMTITSDGAATATSSFRAPIFYDSDNTSYYVNPNGESSLYGLTVNGGTANMSTDATLYVTASNSNDWGIWLNKPSLEYGFMYTLAASHSYGIRGMANSSEYWRVGTDLLYHNSNIRAPIFYDSDNTSYYVNPASTTYLYNLTTAGPITSASSIISGGNNGFFNDVYYSGSRNPIWAFNNATGYGLSYFQGSSGLGGVDTIGIHPNGTATGSGSVLMITSSYTQSLGSMRAPIFYDSDNTAYYVNPNGTSNLSSTYIGGHYFGSYNANNISLQTSTTGEAGLLLRDSGGNFRAQMYGDSAGNYGFLDGAWASWDLQKTIDGNLYLNGNGSYYLNLASDNNFYRVYGQADIRSPIYYDLNNTAYYVDPASTTVLNVLNAVTKSFLIDHPTKSGKKLRYACLEGPENGVYVRGKLTGENTIELPEYWTKLVDPDSITVTLTPIGNKQDLFVSDISNNIVTISSASTETIKCFYVVYGERVDVDKLEVEI